MSPKKYWLTPEVWQDVCKSFNFFRVHLIFLYAYGNISIDALLNSVSEMTVCGLTTVNLGGLTPWQHDFRCALGVRFSYRG